MIRRKPWLLSGDLAELNSEVSVERRMKALLLSLLLFPPLAMAAPKYRIQVRNQFGGWQQYQTVHHLPSATRSAQSRAEKTGKQHRIIDEDGNLVDLLYP